MFGTRRAAWRMMVAMDILTQMNARKITPNLDTDEIYCTILGVRCRMDHNLTVTMLEKHARREPVTDYKISGSQDVFEKMGDKWNARNQQTSAWRELGENPRRNDFGEICQKATIEGYEGWDEPKYVPPRPTLHIVTRLDDAPRKFSQARRKFILGK